MVTVRPSWRSLVLVAAAMLAGLVSLTTVPSVARADVGFAALATPVISGVPQQGGALTVIAGAYTVEPDSFDYQWYADGDPVGTSVPIYRPSGADLGTTVTVDVTAHHVGDPDVTTSSAGTTPVIGGGHAVGWGGGLGGDWDVDSHGDPVQPAVLDGTMVTALAAGRDHWMALTSEGDVATWGTLGRAVPPEVAAADITAISAGRDHALALTSEGKVIAWGSSTSGQSTVPSSLDDETVIAVAGGSDHSLALTSDGRVVGWGLSPMADVPAELDGKTVVAIAAGDWKSMALTSDGKLVAWGNGNPMPSGLSSTTVVAMTPGTWVDLAITSDGVVTRWAVIDPDDLADLPAELTGKVTQAIGMGHDHALAVTSDGSVAAWGYNSLGKATVPAQVAAVTVTAAAASWSGSGVVVSDLVVTQQPSITGDPRVDATLTADPGTTVPAADSVTYQWLLDGAPVDGATDLTFSPSPDQIGSEISVEVTATRAKYADVTATTPAVGPVTNGTFTTGPTPTITGTVQVGQELTADPGTITPTPEDVTYQWNADGDPVDGATASTFTPGPDQEDAHLTVTVTASRTAYDDATATSEPTDPVATDQAPTITLDAVATTVRLGQSTKLTWTTTRAATVHAKGGWKGTWPENGSARVRPKWLGTTVYKLTATNPIGTVTAQVAVTVGRPPADLFVRVPGGTGVDHHAGDKVKITTVGLAKGETYTITIGNRVVADGTTRHARLVSKVTLPRTTRPTTMSITVTGSLPDRTGTTRVHVLPGAG